MLFTVNHLIASAQHVRTEIDGLEVPCRPNPWPWHWRIGLAWGVLIGKYDAIKWPENQ